jgi:hypothetical protein
VAKFIHTFEVEIVTEAETHEEADAKAMESFATLIAPIGADDWRMADFGTYIWDDNLAAYINL